MHTSLRTAARWALAFISAASGLTKASEPPPVRQVAIIGAGAAGSSTAYFLSEFASAAGVAVNITVFEKESRVGGRTLTIDPFGNASQRVELGASIFIAKNLILTDASRFFALEMREPYEDVLPIMGVWDGAAFVLSVDTSQSTWWNTLKIIWKYGISAPRATSKLVDGVVGKFLKLYDAPYFPWRSLTQRVYDIGLLETTAVTGEQFLKTNGISDLYAHDIIQASTRVNYASNLAYIHGLDTMVSMAPEGAVSVEGGNWQIFQRMVNHSSAHLALNTTVTSIALNPTRAFSSVQPWKYVLSTRPTGSDTEEVLPTEFDNVVLAGPYQFSNIQAADHVLQHAIDKIPYVQLHVTIFASPFLVSPVFFGLPSTEIIPGMILTTLGKNDTATSGAQGVGSAGFFSVNILRKVVNPETGRQEYLYKIFSPEKVTAEFLSRLFNVPVPERIIDHNAATGSKPVSTSPNAEPADDQTVDPISWYYPWVVHSYPKALPRVTFQDPVVGAGLYYTAGMESFISTMETNALAGKNVARLIVDDILEQSAAVIGEKEEEQDAKKTQGLVEESEQRLLDSEL